MYDEEYEYEIRQTDLCEKFPLTYIRHLRHLESTALARPYLQEFPPSTTNLLQDRNAFGMPLWYVA